MRREGSVTEACWRRPVAGAAVAWLLAAGLAWAGARRFESPNGAVEAELAVDASGQVTYALWFRGRPVVPPSPLGLTLEGRELGQVASLTAISVREVHERFPVRGAHAVGQCDARMVLFTAVPRAGEPYGLQLAVADGGFAWRFLVPGGAAPRRVNAETACWRLPPESRVWYAERLSDWKLKTYAGEWVSAPLSALPTVSPKGPLQTMPLVVELPDALGYAAVTEAALFQYSGLRLEARPGGELRGVFSEAEGFVREGRFRTPWRVLLLAPTLDALVNSDLVAGLCPPPDPALFDPPGWTEGGRSVWSWWQGAPDALTPEGERRVIDGAARLGFEFTTVDEGWEGWPEPWERLRELCDYARERKVRVFVWKHAKELNVPAEGYAALRTFLDKVREAGASGVKVDFMNGEDLGLVTFDEWVLQEAARRRLLVNFHGCQKPTGESRTYPNEVTREAVRGLELNRIAERHRQRLREKGVAPAPAVPGGENQELPASHNAALPFTRCVVGQADYTPLAFSRPGETTWAHQLAMAYLVTSPLLVMAEHPERLLGEPRLAAAVPFIRSLPVAWDETRVLDGSRIGELAALARRKGGVWYVAVVNGTGREKLMGFSPWFTGWSKVRVAAVGDEPGRPDGLVESGAVLGGMETAVVRLAPFGGYVARLTRD